MTKKRTKRRTGHAADRTDRGLSPQGFNRKISNQVMAALYLADTELSLNDIVKTTGLPRSGKDLVEEALAGLCSAGIARKSGKRSYTLGAHHRLAEATVEKNPRGFGFATAIGFRSGGEAPRKDPFIAIARMGSAHHGDRVLVELSRPRRDGRSEAEVLHVLERKTRQLAGFFLAGKKHDTVYPEDPRFPFDIICTSRPSQPIADGDAVIVRLLDGNDDGRTPRGEIVEILGNPDNISVQVRLVASKFELPHRFSAEAEAAARNGVPVPGPGEREDLREIAHVTIDGEHAKDFDDAVAVSKTKGGFRLYVSIADVSAFVKPGSALDREAYDRGTSVYFPGTVIPMLPENLSNNLCSLLPDTDRLTVSAILDFDRRGARVNSRFVRSVIRSRQRFTYDTVRRIVVDRDPEIRSRYKPFLTPLKWAAELAEALQTRRTRRGSIGFTIPEPDIRLDEDGRVTSITRAERNFAHQIIEEFMLAANEAVAAAFTERESPLLYRIHEQPDPEKVKDFVSFSRSLGLDLPKEEKTPAWYNRVITSVAGTPREYIVNNLLLRTMQQARYSNENAGHFGLAAEDYTHFTSPIRRYPDLIVHRLLCRLIADPARQRQPGPAFSPSASLPEDGRHLSARERVAVNSERDMAERLKRQFMARRIGEVFRAVVSGVSDTVFFVELLDTFVSGAVALSTLTDDYYLLDEKHHRLIGDVGGRILQIGDVVEVVLLDVDQHQNRIQFTLVGPGAGPA